MCQLPRPQQPHNQELVPVATDWGVVGQVRKSQTIHTARLDQCILPNENPQKRRVENRIQDLIRSLQILSDAFRSNERSNKLLRIYQQDSCGEAWHFCHCIPGWHSDLHWWWWGWIRLSRAVGTGAVQEILTVCQPEEVSISLERSLVPRLCIVFKRHLHGGRKNQGCQAVAWAPVSTRHLSVPWICKFLSTIHLGI